MIRITQKTDSEVAHAQGIVNNLKQNKMKNLHTLSAPKFPELDGHKRPNIELIFWPTYAPSIAAFRVGQVCKFFILFLL